VASSRRFARNRSICRSLPFTAIWSLARFRVGGWVAKAPRNAMPLIVHWFRAFVWTLALEQVAAGWVLRRQVPALRRIGLITVSNLASHPAVWLIFPELGAGLGWTRMGTLVVSEVWAFGLEALIYALFLGRGHARQAAIASTLANAVSLSLGFGLRALGWV
jgi:hypothetical protein